MVEHNKKENRVQKTEHSVLVEKMSGLLSTVNNDRPTFSAECQRSEILLLASHY